MKSWVRLAFTLGTLLGTGCGTLPGGSSPKSVILITVDTLRADRVGLYGRLLATPHFDEVGREGATVLTAYAPVPRTTQAVGSLMTGLFPTRHGADGLGMRLPEGVTTLAEILKGYGYDTAAFATNIVLQPGFGFEQGFDLFSNPSSRWLGDSAFSLTDEALAWLRSRSAGGRPFFLWVHYLDPHWSYEPSAEFARRVDPDWDGTDDVARRVESGVVPWGKLIFAAPSTLTAAEIERTRRLYDAEVLQTDAAFGRLIDGLRDLGRWDDAVIAFTSDHGESLGEHDYWFAHGEYLYDTTLHVPLMVRAAGLVPSGTRVSGIVRLEDLMPTLLELAGQAVPADLDGASIAAALRAGGDSRVANERAAALTDHLLIRDENPRRPVSGREGRWWSLREGSSKLIRIPVGPETSELELYDTGSDPLETRDLAGDRASEAERLAADLVGLSQRLVEEAGTAAEGHADPEALRSLGYAR